MRPIATAVALAWSVGLYVYWFACWSQPYAVLKRINRRQDDVSGERKMCFMWGRNDPTHGRTLLRVSTRLLQYEITPNIAEINK